MVVKRGEGNFSEAYRPCRISEIRGQEETKTSIKNILNSDHIENALLFHGPPGTGKTTLARIIALGLLCENDRTSEPCCTCQSCRHIIFSHSDHGYFEYNVAEIKGIDDLRGIAKTYFGQKFLFNERKVFVFDECQKLTKDMQTFFLKAVESAVNEDIFIFCSTELKNFSEPLRDRFTEYEFKKLEDSQLYSLINDVCENEKIKPNQSVLENIVAESNGKARKAMKNLRKAFTLEELKLKQEGQIEHFSGKGQVLVVAPHGAPGDENDDFTSDIAKRIQSELGCYAVINEKYSKNQADLNSISTIQKDPELETEFLHRIRGYKDEIKGKGLQPMVIYIHGAKEGNIKKTIPTQIGVSVIIGYGQGNQYSKPGETRITLTDHYLDSLVDALKSNGLPTAEAPPGSRYCGWTKDNLNQLFNLEEHKDYYDPAVQSVQLEIAALGLRGNAQEAAETGEKLSKALRPFIQAKHLPTTSQHTTPNLDDTMNKNEVLFRCKHCGMEYDCETLDKLADGESVITLDVDNSLTIHALCLQCQKALFVFLDSETSDKFFNSKKTAEDDCKDRCSDELEELDLARAAIPAVPTAPAVAAVASVPAEGPDSKIEAFIEEVGRIDKELPGLERAKKVRDALVLLVDEISSDTEVCMGILKDELGLNSREVEAFKRDFRQIQAKAKLQREMAGIQHLTQEPKEMAHHEIEEALDYLRHPDLVYNISKDLAFAGDIVGEETNSIILYFAAISRKLKNPISVVIFGKSSSGKSHLANAVADFVPPEDRLLLSSVSRRAFEQYAETLKQKFIVVQEWEGAEEILPTLRTLQSEGKLLRLVAKGGNSTNEPLTQPIECPCSVVITTTKENIHNENDTRIFKIYADESIAQNEAVVKKTLIDSDLRNKSNKSEKENILNLHHNVQRLLEPVDEITIPYGKHLTFPAKTTRNRRDSGRFIQLIKVVAFLRQKQKEYTEINGTNCIEADLDDYQIAYDLSIKVISSTLSQVSNRAKGVLTICCQLADELKQASKSQTFSVSEIQEKAAEFGLEYHNRDDLYKQLEWLERYEYLTLSRSSSKGKKRYSVSFNYERDQNGEIVNITTPDVMEITTPDELRAKWDQPRPLKN